MDKQEPNAPSSREITDPEAFFSRRTLLHGGILAATAVATGLVYRSFNHRHTSAGVTPLLANNGTNGTPTTQAVQDAGLADHETLTPYDSITHYNNFYEFSTDKESVASECGNFKSKPWTLSVGGLCRKPTTFDIDDLRKLIPVEERIFRMRCVETWSMVIPWNGFALSKLLERVEPLSSAKYVTFQTQLDRSNFTNQRAGVLDWPYVEGLRMDEAMNPLATLAVGLYGRELPAQDGAPIRLAVPWKYGFKGAKSLVKIDLVADQPPSTWNKEAPTEYGFYANVNPDVDHPRWSQAMETRIIGTREFHRQPTLLFNGYGEQVAHLYSGMDLHHYF